MIRYSELYDPHKQSERKRLMPRNKKELIGHIGSEVVISKSVLDDDSIDRLRKMLVLKKRAYRPDDEDRIIEFFDETDVEITVPRGIGIQLANAAGLKLKDKTSKGDARAFTFRGDLRNDQPKAYSMAIKALYSDRMGGVVKAPCASGKTILGLYTLAKLGRKTIVLMHSDDLIQQWKERIIEFLGDEVKVGVVKGTKEEWDSDIVLASIQTVIRRDIEGKVAKSFGTLVVDECITGDALIETDKGPVRLDSLNTIDPTYVLCYDENGDKWVYRRLKKWIERGRRKTIKISLSGATLRCTPDHKVLTTRGWKYAKDLVMGEEILSPAHVDAEKASLIETSEVDLEATHSDTICEGLELIGERERLRSTKQPQYVVVDAAKSYGLVKTTSGQDAYLATVRQKHTEAHSGCDLLNRTPRRGWTTSFQKITKIEDVRSPGDLVYDLEVEEHHNFVANGLLVHNCHHISSERWRFAVKQFPARYRLGLTATPRRGDGLAPMIFWSMGDVISEMTGTEVTAKVIAVMHNLFFPDFLYLRDGKLNGSAFKTWVSKLRKRNENLGVYLSGVMTADRKIIALSDRVDQLKWLLRYFSKTKSREEVVLYTGKEKSGTLEEAKNAQLLLSTYGMLSEGFDVPSMDTLFLLTPRSDVEQSVGRIVRSAKDKKQPVVFDLVDLDINTYDEHGSNHCDTAKMFKRRHRFYSEKGYEVKFQDNRSDR